MLTVNLHEDGAAAPYATAVRLDEAIPDPSERIAAERELNRFGRYWAGGGAAPLVLLMLNR